MVPSIRIHALRVPTSRLVQCFPFYDDIDIGTPDTFACLHVCMFACLGTRAFRAGGSESINLSYYL